MISLSGPMFFLGGIMSLPVWSHVLSGGLPPGGLSPAGGSASRGGGSASRGLVYPQGVGTDF